MSEEAPAACAVCEGAIWGAVMVRLAEGRLVRCDGCGSWNYLPRRSPSEQAALHDTAEYFEHPYFEKRRRAHGALRRRCRETFRRIGEAVDSASLRGQRVLDVGCDTGAFLRSATDLFGVVPVGLDVAAHAVREATARGIEAYRADLEGAPAHLRDFPLVTAIDVIEHIVRPVEFLREVRARLRPSGVAYVETVNARSMVYQVGRLLCGLTGGRPRATFERLFPAQHVQYFTREGLAGLARKCGLEVVRVDQRVLPFREIGTSLPVRLGLAGVQITDWVRGDGILIWALLRNPDGK